MLQRILPGLSANPARESTELQPHQKAVISTLVLAIPAILILATTGFFTLIEAVLCTLAALTISGRFLTLAHFTPTILGQIHPRFSAVIIYVGGWLLLFLLLAFSLFAGKHAALIFGIAVCASEILLITFALFFNRTRSIA